MRSRGEEEEEVVEEEIEEEEEYGASVHNMNGVRDPTSAYFNLESVMCSHTLASTP